MGRTSPTFRDTLQAIEERWADYRRALRRRNQPRFDRLFAYARDHADAGGLLNHATPLFPALLSIDLEQEARLDEHAARLDQLEDALDEPPAADQTPTDPATPVGTDTSTTRRDGED